MASAIASDSSRTRIINSREQPYHQPGTSSPGHDEAESPFRRLPQPSHPTPKNAQFMKEPKLNVTPKAAVEEMLEKYHLPNRCLVTQETGPLHYCHLVARTTRYDQVETLSKCWGLPRDEPFDVNSAINIVIESPTWHRMLEEKGLLLVPDDDLLEQVIQAQHEQGQRNADGELVKTLFELFSKPPKGGWGFRALPLQMDQKRSIFVHKMKLGRNGSWDSTGKYVQHRWPCVELRIRTHASPLCAVWHAAVQMCMMPKVKVQEISKQLVHAGAADLANTMAKIIDLCDLWRVDNPPPFASVNLAPANTANQSGSERDSGEGTLASQFNSSSSVPPVIRAAASAPGPSTYAATSTSRVHGLVIGSNELVEALRPTQTG
ncbi:hypothetical protein C8R47DRAFT_1144674 [Mycena vitilis]|nr:hypothetical protein C8R47DRAFT_1144674 [Mycena vitilis]